MEAFTKTEGSILAGRDCKEIVFSEYGIQPTSMVRQRGWCDVTYLVKAESGEHFVFKVFIDCPIDGTSKEQVEAEISMINFLGSRDIPVPRILKNKSGSFCGEAEFFDSEKGKHIKRFRLQTFIPGSILDRRLNVEICSQMGDLNGRVAHALADYHNDFYAAKPDIDFIVTFADIVTVREMIQKLPDKHNQHLANEYLKWYDATIGSTIDQLPKQQIHCDMHGSNLIVNDDATKVIGLIDFSDSRVSLRIVEPSVALFVILMFSQDSLKCAKSFLNAFENHIKLSPVEKAALSPAIAGRLVREMCIHNYLIATQPVYNRSYLDNIFGNGWSLVERFLDPNSAERQFFDNI